MRGGWLVVFAKAPQPGAVKTRLCPPLSPRQAAELYRCCLSDVLEESGRAAEALGLELVVAIDPAGEAPSIARLARPGARVVAQCGVDLGARMAHASRQAAAAGASCAVLRGSDSPALSEHAIADALAALADVDLALAPDRDGGYGLVALGERALARGFGRPSLFDHPMSTPRVLRDTLAQADVLRLASRWLAPSFDLDRFEDLRHLAEARFRQTPLPCPRTLRYLDQNGLWPAGRAADSR